MNHGFSSSSVSIEAIAKCFPNIYLSLSSSSLCGNLAELPLVLWVLVFAPLICQLFPPQWSHRSPQPSPALFYYTESTGRNHTEGTSSGVCSLRPWIVFKCLSRENKANCLGDDRGCGEYWWQPSLSSVVLANLRRLHGCTFSAESTQLLTCTH